MYAYCSNNPVMYKDPSGAGIGLALGGGYLIYEFLKCLATSVLIAGGVTLSTALVFEGIDVISNTISKADEDEKTETKDKTYKQRPDNSDDSIYRGAKIVGDDMIYITSPMTFDEAVTWAFAVSPTMGISTKWGLYTKNQSDAAMIAAALLSKDPKISHITDPLHHDFGQKKYIHIIICQTL